MKDKRLVIAVACILAIAGSAFWIRSTRQQRRPKTNLSPFEALGLVTATETGNLIGSQGRVLVLNYATSQGRRPTIDAQVAGIRKALGKHPALSLAGVQAVEAHVPEIDGREGIDPAAFLDSLSQHADVDAVISLVGPPLFEDGQFPETNQKQPKVVVVFGPSAVVKKLLGTGAIQLAIMPRLPPPVAGSQPGGSAREQFDHFWQVVTETNAAALPD